MQNYPGSVYGDFERLGWHGVREWLGRIWCAGFTVFLQHPQRAFGIGYWLIEVRVFGKIGEAER